MSLLLCGCASQDVKKEVVFPLFQPGLMLPGYAKSVLVEVLVPPEYLSLQEPILKYIQRSIQTQYPDLGFTDQPKPFDLCLVCSLNSISTGTSPTFCVEIVLWDSGKKEKKAEQKASLSCDFQDKETMREQIYQAFCTWFENCLGLRSSYQRIFVYGEQKKLLSLLSQGKIEAAIYSLNSDIFFSLEQAKKQSLTQKQALQLGRLYETRSALLEILGQNIMAKQDRERADYLFSLSW